MNKKEKILVDKKRIIFYIWLSIGFLTISMLSNLHRFPETFFERALNDIWRLAYVAVLHYILFEYSWPYIKKKWKKVFLPLLLIFVHAMLYSWGLFAWR